MKHRVLFAGIDGSGKTTCLNLLIPRMESKYSITKIGNCDPCTYYRGESKSFFRCRYYSVIERIRPISIKYHFHSLFLIFNFIYKLLVSKYAELSTQSDLIMYETDTLLHPAVYINYHLPFTRVIHSKLKFSLLSLIFGSKNNSSIFYLDTAPEVAMKRIHRRASHINAHENTRDLTKLKKDFEIVQEVALRQGYAIYRIDTNNRSLEEVAREVERIVETKMPNRPEAWRAITANGI